MVDSSGRWLRLDRRLAGLSLSVQLLVATLLLVACGLADLYTGSEISLSIIYLAPVTLTVWYAGAAAGVIMAISASILWLVVDLHGGPSYSHPMVPVWNSLVRLGFFLIVTTLLLQIHQLLRRLESQAATDGLTGLANSRIFSLRLNQELERALRYRRPFTVAYLDLDNFKIVNDTWGHEAGDQVLKVIAESLKTSLRKTDLVARLGGDEFALLLAETGEREAREALYKLHGRLLKKMTENQWPVGCSLGAVTCLDPARVTPNALIHQADELMYRIKQSGKNRLAFAVAG